MVTLEFLATLQQQPLLLTAVVFVFGLLIGSFLNVVIFRLPVMLEAGWKTEARAILEIEEPEAPSTRFNLIVPNSRCPSCGHQIRWFENIPVASWLILRGKCSQCGTSISSRYPIIELACGLMSATVAMVVGYGAELLPALAFTWVLIALAMIDYDTMLLPDQLTLPLLWGGLLAALTGHSAVDLRDAVTGAMFGYLALWSVFWLFKLVTGKEGMGYGDFKLLAALGAWMGWQMIPLIVLLSSLVGAIVGITLIATHLIKREQGIPFGPYLAAAGWIALLWGNTLISQYLQLFQY